MISVKVLGIEFEIGKNYEHNKWGEYTVLAFLCNDKMEVRFGEGEKSEVKTLGIRLAANMIFNNRCELAKSLNRKSVVVNGSESQIAYTIGRIAKYGCMCITRILDNKYEAFKIRYEKCGNNIEKIENISILCNNANKCGTEYTIQLPKGFNNNESFALPEGTNLIEHRDGGFTINDNKFWWCLVEKFGLRLGKNQDIENMKRVCPKSLIDNTGEGLFRWRKGELKQELGNSQFYASDTDTVLRKVNNIFTDEKLGDTRFYKTEKGAEKFAKS